MEVHVNRCTFLLAKFRNDCHFETAEEYKYPRWVGRKDSGHSVPHIFDKTLQDFVDTLHAF